jgi:hypothetical protein
VTRRTTRWLAMTLGLVAVYSGVLVWAGPTAPERFPFFRWELFSKVPPPERSDFGVRIVAIGDEVLDPPLYFEQARRHFPLARSPEGYQLIQRWGSQLRRGELLRADTTRKLLEARYLVSAEPVRYELVARTYDVLDRAACECFTSEEVRYVHPPG